MDKIITHIEALEKLIIDDNNIEYEEQLVVFASINAGFPVFDTVFVSRTAGVEESVDAPEVVEPTEPQWEEPQPFEYLVPEEDEVITSPEPAANGVTQMGSVADGVIASNAAERAPEDGERFSAAFFRLAAA